MSTKATETLADILNGLGLEDVAIGEKLGYTGMAVNHWRNLRSVPSAKVWNRIAQLSGRTIEDIACAIARGVKPVPGRVANATVATRTRR